MTYRKCHLVSSCGSSAIHQYPQPSRVSTSTPTAPSPHHAPPPLQHRQAEVLRTSTTLPSGEVQDTSTTAGTLTKQLSMEQDTLPARLMSRRGGVASERHAAYRAAAHPVHEEPALPFCSLPEPRQSLLSPAALPFGHSLF